MDDDAFVGLAADPRFVALAGAPVESATTRVEGWRGDRDYLIAEVRRLDPRYSREPFPPAFDAAAASLRPCIPEISGAAVAVELQRLLRKSDSARLRRSDLLDGS